MKSVVISSILLMLFCFESNGQYYNYTPILNVNSKSSFMPFEQEDPDYIDLKEKQFWNYFLAVIPGAVQIQKGRYGYAAGFIGSTVAFTTLTVSQSAIIRKARIDADADPTHADYYDRRIHKAKQWRTIGWIGLGLTEALNYVIAIRLDYKQKEQQLSVFADPLGSIGITYAVHF